MKITFVRPNMAPCRSSDACEPVVFGILSALTPPDVTCVLHDERRAPLPLDEPTDLVAITVETFTARRAYEIAAHYLDRGIPVVLGGYHPTLCPEEALRYASSIVIGDAEGVWAQLVEDARRGRLRRVYRRRFPSLAESAVDRSIFHGMGYQRIAFVQYGRGCRYACDFCSIHAFYGSNRRWRPLSNVVEEIRGLEQRHIFFCDDNLYNDRERFEALLDAVEPLHVRWSCQISLDVAAEPTLLRRMARAGCMSMLIGLETLDLDNLRQMRKAWNRAHGSYEELLGAIRREGIMVYAGFVLGYDHDTVEAFDTTLEFAIRNRLFLANFNPLAPTPGAALYDRLREEGRLIHDPWWLHDGYRYGQSMFHPRQMTAEALEAGCYRARTVFNRWRSIAYRMRDRKANCGTFYNAATYFLANVVSRREIHRKQGRPLGSGIPLVPRCSADASAHELAAAGSTCG